MTLSRIDQKRDANEKGIVDALIGMGCSVDCLPGGGGRMDLLIGYRGHDIKMEIKMPGKELNPKQKEYHRQWKGAPIYLAHTFTEAVSIVLHVTNART